MKLLEAAFQTSDKLCDKFYPNWNSNIIESYKNKIMSDKVIVINCLIYIAYTSTSALTMSILE